MRGKVEPRPAGVLYCLLQNPTLSGSGRMSREDAEKKLLDRLRMRGWLLNDANVIRNIDGTSRHIRVKLKNDGAIDGTTKGGVKAEREFDALAAYTMKKLREAGAKVLSGDVEVSPFHTKTKNACAFCPYGDVCGFDVKLGRFAYRELDDTITFMKEMEQEGGDDNANG